MSEIVNASAVRFDSLSATGDGYTLLSINGKVCKSDKLLSEMVQSAVDSEHFATEQWVNEQGFIKEETDWTETIKEASANAVDSAIDWVEDQGYLTEHQSISADEWNSCYETVSANSATWMTETDWTNDINAASAYALDEAKTWVENQNYITGVDLSNYYQKTETSGASEISGALDLKEDKVFVAEYNVTPYADIKAAYDAGKQIVCKYVENESQTKFMSLSQYVAPTNIFIFVGWSTLRDSTYVHFSLNRDGIHTDYQVLSNSYYAQTETSGRQELISAFNTKQDKLNFEGENNTITAINSSAIGGGESTTYNNGYLIDIDSNNNINIRNNNCIANTANYAYALGNSNSATGSESLAVGFGNKATQNWAVAIGKDNNAFGTYGVALGNNTSAGNYSLTFGQQNSAVEYSIAGGLGNSARTYAIAFGSNNMVTGDQAGVAIGFANSSYNAFAYGKLNNVNGPSTGFAAAFGISNSVTKDLSFAFGNANTANHSLTFMFGTRCITNGTNAVALGSDCIANGNNSFACGNLTKANGYCSHAEGQQTTATGGNGAHSEGYLTQAKGSYSHAEGTSTIANNNGAHAEGNATVANGDCSHAEGQSTTAQGQWSHAEGNQTNASGNYAHTEGQFCVAGVYGHAEGYYTTAIGLTNGDYAAHAEGYNTQALGGGTHAEGRDTKANGNCSHAEGYQTTAIGKYSHSEGWSTTAQGEASHAAGKGTIALYNYETVVGHYNVTAHDELPASGKPIFVVGNGNANNSRSDAFIIDLAGNTSANDFISYNGVKLSECGAGGGGGGSNYTAGTDIKIENNTISVNNMDCSAVTSMYSVAIGLSTSALSYGSFTHGENTLANIGRAAHAEGLATQALGNYSHSEGSNTSATGEDSHSEGYYTKATERYSHAEGRATSAQGEDSHAEGYSTSAVGKHAHAEGEYSKATGETSHSEGYDTSAIGNYAHAEGYQTIANSNYSHSEGQETSAIGMCSHAEGYKTKAESMYMHVCGKFNKTSSNALFVVGNGTANKSRSDAFIVTTAGVASATNMMTSAGNVVATNSIPTANQVLTYNGTNVTWADAQGGGGAGGLSPISPTSITPILEDNVYKIIIPSNNAYYIATIDNTHDVEITPPTIGANEMYNVVLFVIANDFGNKQMTIAYGDYDVAPMDDESKYGRVYGHGFTQFIFFGRGFTMKTAAYQAG